MGGDCKMSDCNVCILNEVDCYTDFFHAEFRTAKKPHKCSECEKEIDKGERYQYACGKTEGDFWSFRTCLICDEIRAAFSCEGVMYGGMFWEDMHSQGVFNEMTTGCLDKLKTPEAKKELLRRWNEWRFA
jgi:hypothetical protein